MKTVSTDERTRPPIIREIGTRAYNTLRYMRPGDGRYGNIIRRLRKSQVPWLRGLLDVFSTAYVLGMDHTDYFDYRLFELSREDRRSWAGRGVYGEFLRAFNDPDYCEIFRNKCRFLEVFSPYIRREWLPISAATEPAEFSRWCERHPTFFAKPLYGLRGTGVIRVCQDGTEPAAMLQDLLAREIGLVEEEIRQHPTLKAINPSSVNTVRVVTLRLNENVRILSAVLRMGCGGVVDNLAAGGYAAPLDIATGVVTGPAVDKKGGLKGRCDRHPLTQAMILGVAVPEWKRVLTMIKEAALVVPQVRTVGWDIAIAEDGPVLVEANDAWCRKLLQLPYGKGAARELIALMPQPSAYHRQVFRHERLDLPQNGRLEQSTCD